MRATLSGMLPVDEGGLAVRARAPNRVSLLVPLWGWYFVELGLPAAGS